MAVPHALRDGGSGSGRTPTAAGRGVRAGGGGRRDQRHRRGLPVVAGRTRGPHPRARQPRRHRRPQPPQRVPDGRPPARRVRRAARAALLALARDGRAARGPRHRARRRADAGLDTAAAARRTPRPSPAGPGGSRTGRWAWARRCSATGRASAPTGSWPSGPGWSTSCRSPTPRKASWRPCSGPAGLGGRGGHGGEAGPAGADQLLRLSPRNVPCSSRGGAILPHDAGARPVPHQRHDQRARRVRARRRATPSRPRRAGHPAPRRPRPRAALPGRQPRPGPRAGRPHDPRGRRGRPDGGAVPARLDYDRLDLPGNRVRVRLSSPVVLVRNDGPAETATSATVGYFDGETVRTVRAGAVILACWHAMIPYLVPDLPQHRRVRAAAHGARAHALRHGAGARLARLARGGHRPGAVHRRLLVRRPAARAAARRRSGRPPTPASRPPSTWYGSP